ncbi:MAG: alanyl-tRNA synthetase [Synergistaceae bacterium]|nr:alanyl-tRNA synthetase [Synergistaceae bacterium]
MQWRSGKEIRSLFIDFWVSKGSRHFPSFSLIPDDPSLLFTIAGMVPFKPYYLGIRKPEAPRAVTSQKCVRTNDIDNVGRTARHHTFFEMLGNFAWGDYFKKESITWGWEFLTEVIGLEPDRMSVTIYEDDDEAYDAWHKLVGIPDARIFRFGKDDNFWFMGNQGPCGPCSEIMYDQGPEFSCGRPECAVGCDCDRYLEIWNHVFTQFDLQKDGTLVPLPKKNIDTGMGLERLTSIVQRVRTDFETDLFMPMIERACAMGGIHYGYSPKTDLAVRVIADHVRSVAFMIADGILPSNDGRGYVLRRLLRRAARFGRLLGVDRPFLLEFLPDVIGLMGDPYRELIDNRLTVEQIIDVEEKRFCRTLEQGTELLDGEVARLRGAGRTELPGDVAFVLYDTYGFPLELTMEIADENGFTVDRAGFDREMAAQRERARASSKQKRSALAGDVYSELNERLGDTPFTGYEVSESENSVAAIVVDGEETESLEEGMEGEIILDTTPFYGEKGGQVGDTGTIASTGGKAEVTDTVIRCRGLVVHKVKVLSGSLAVGDAVRSCVNDERRRAVRRNHTATHLLHEALGRVLGGHVRQSGSLVGESSLRFDFTHFEAMSREQLLAVEMEVNARILENRELTVEESDMEHAREMGAKALFEEKYGDVVRVVRIPGFSAELCGGLHVASTGEIGCFKILREEGIGSGTRRITAVTGLAAVRLFQKLWRYVNDLGAMLAVDENAVLEKVEQLQAEVKALRRKRDEEKMNALSARLQESLHWFALPEGVQGVYGSFGAVGADALREIGDRLKNGKREDALVILLASVDGDNVQVVAMADDEAVEKGVSAGKIVREASKMLGGGGGGRPNLAQGGGKDSAALPKVFESFQRWVEGQIRS